jgi:hypothetical protein
MRHTLSVVCVALVGCAPGELELASRNADVIDVDAANAEEAGHTTSTTADGAACPGLPADDAGAEDAGASIAPVLGAWTGYIENFTLLSGSSAVNVVFALQSDGSPGGTVVFGMGTPPPPPTDPDAGYWPSGLGNAPTAVVGQPIEGFTYTLHAFSFDGVRLQFGAESREVYRAWCDLQTTTYVWDQCTYGCLPNWGGAGSSDPTGTITLEGPGGATMAVNYGKFELCDEYPTDTCNCFPNGCTVLLNDPDLHFDTQVKTQIDGSIVLNGSSYNVHLTTSSAEPSDR